VCVDGEEVKRARGGGEVDGDEGWLRLTNEPEVRGVEAVSARTSKLSVRARRTNCRSEFAVPGRAPRGRGSYLRWATDATGTRRATARAGHDRC
jgi:hypothetical protein